MRQNVLVTGVGGFIGSVVAQSLLDRDYHVIGVDDFSSGDVNRVPKSVDLVVGDLTKNDVFETLFLHDIDYIMHFAAQSSGEVSFEDPERDLLVNSLATLKLIKLAEQKKNIASFFYKFDGSLW